MSKLNNTHATDFAMARALSNLACMLDEHKKHLPKPLQGAALGCVEGMHDMAEVLLGFDCDKVYAKDDPTAIAILRVAHQTQQNGEAH